MRRDVLFVDDEHSLLNGVQRRMKDSFNVFTADSGKAALQLISERTTPFPVIITDMRMPEMDGLEFIEAARPKSPNTSFIMLTGSQDRVTATDAVNRGHVFGFLDKPCDGFQLRFAIEQAIRKYDIYAGKKELLEKTFCGAVSVLNDLLEVGQPELFRRTAKIEDTLMTALNSANVPQRWEYHVAAKLSLVGAALLESDQREQLYEEWSRANGANSMWRRAAEIGKRLVERIPQLGLVAEIVGHHATVDGSISSLEPIGGLEVVDLGASMLRAAVQWEALRDSKLETRTARIKLQRVMPGLSKRIIESLPAFERDWEASGPVEVPLDQLREGMVLQSSISAADGIVLVGAGRRLTQFLIEKLRARALHDASLRSADFLVIREQESGTGELLSTPG